MKIRAHHLLCIQGFQGYGYSEDFNENMAKIIKNLELSPKQKIQIITECDVICSCCPHNINKICSKDPESHEKIMKMDINVLKKLGITTGSVFEADEIFKIVNKKLKTYHDIQEICGNCKWKKKCIWFISKSK